MARRRAGAAALPLLALLAQAPVAAAQTPSPPQPPPFVLSSPAFQNFGALPRKYAPNAARAATFEALSPPINWTNPPPRTRALALTMTDLEASQGGNPQDLVLWMVVNIPPVIRGLAEGTPRGRTAMLPEGAFQRSFLTNGYIGPQPGADRRTHHYLFELHALDQPLDVPRDVTLDQLKTAMKGHEIAEPRVLVATCCAASP